MTAQSNLHRSEYVQMAALVRDGERFRHLNTGRLYFVTGRDSASGRLLIARPGDKPTQVWPDYLLNPHNFERMGPPVVLS